MSRLAAAFGTVRRRQIRWEKLRAYKAAEMMFIKSAPNSHGLVDPRDSEELWIDQVDWVCHEYDYAVFAITIHPDVSGRPQVLLMLERICRRDCGRTQESSISDMCKHVSSHIRRSGDIPIGQPFERAYRPANGQEPAILWAGEDGAQRFMRVTGGKLRAAAAALSSAKSRGDNRRPITRSSRQPVRATFLVQ